VAFYRGHGAQCLRYEKLATSSFSKSIQMHDIVIGLFVNYYAFGLLV
jgi:hypothetical protein